MLCKRIFDQEIVITVDNINNRTVEIDSLEVNEQHVTFLINVSAQYH